MMGFPPLRTSCLACLCTVLAFASIAPEGARPAVAGRFAAAAPGVDRSHGPGGGAPALPAGVASDWWTAVRAQIEQEAYAVRPARDTTPGTFEADNPAQRWQTRFTSAGVAITPMAMPAGDLGGAARPPQSADPGHARHSADTGSPATGASFEQAGPGAAVPPAAEEWTVGLRLAAYGAGDVLTPVSAVAPRGEGARVEFRYGESREGTPALTEWYVNEARGLEHGFTLAEAPAGAGPVTLELAVSGGLQPVLEPDGLAVELRARGGVVRLRYADLFVTDASGRTLPGALSVPAGEPARIHLVVDTRGASYPITIDPLATTPATTLTGEAANNYFGGSVATAGDVNGDGYADVVVGAYGYSGNTGRAYVYLGGPGGLATTPATTLTGEATGNFGESVATAGDVNGDGYADLVVGAKLYGGAKGRAYVYLGGAGGLATTAATTLTGETTSSVFGETVATAGDVNGDGYADVVVGARGDSVNTGRAYVYLGGASGLATTAATTLTGEAAWNFFGMPVATAGDVNGDGYADLVVGAYGYGGGSGRAYVYLGGASGLATTAATTLTGASSDQLGSSVATAGDVNGDGYADVVVGAYYYNAGTGRAYVHLGGASGLATTAATTLTGATNGNYFGYSVATAGDVNGDGFADVVVGAYGYSTNTGRAYAYLGGAGGLATAATLLTGEATANSFGASVATAGDVNGDGYADVVVGASGYSTYTGRAYVYHGGASGLATTAATTTTGAATNNRFGASVATAGDVNGDGYADVVVGAWGYGTNTGRAYVYLGGAGGLATTAATTLTGEAANNYFGSSVATAGDVNGDGYADVVVGAWGYGTNTGRAYVYLGGASGLAATAATTLTGDAAGDRLGTSVAAAGDVNGDGYADVVVGARGFDSYRGKASIYLGGASGLATTAATNVAGEAANNYFGSSVATAGDLNGDGYADVVIGASGYDNSTGRAYVYLGGASGLATTAATTRTGGSINYYFGGSAATAGDVNGDGYADVAIGAMGYNGSQGQTYVYLGGGGALGLATTAPTTLTVDMWDGLQGSSVATAGDVNGDGYADVVVGAQGYSMNTGRAHVYLGGASGLATTPATTLALAGGTTGYYFGISVATAGDVNGDGYADVVVGASGYNTYTGRATVYAGNGGLGSSLAPRTRRADDTAPVAYGGRSDDATAFRLAALGRSPFGRTKVKLEWEVKPLGTSFNGSGTGLSAGWQDTTAAGASLNELVSGLTAVTPYHWRMRVRYHPAGNPFAQYSRWVTQPWVGAQETRLRTGPAVAPTATGIAPPRGGVAGGTAVTITGTSFVVGQTTVTVGGTAATSVVVTSTTSLTAVTPAHVAGAADVVVTTPAGSATLSSGFTYEVPLPLPVFTDNPLTARSTVVKAIHVAELRQAIDALRTRFGLGTFAWTDVTLSPGVVPVKAMHVTELRAALNDVYGAAGSPAPTYTHAVLTGGATVITAVDFAELRAATLAIW